MLYLYICLGTGRVWSNHARIVVMFVLCNVLLGLTVVYRPVIVPLLFQDGEASRSQSNPVSSSGIHTYVHGLSEYCSNLHAQS
jgi:hypothetical protein